MTEKVLEMQLPWRTLKSKLVNTDECGNVFYETSFDELEVKHRHSGVNVFVKLMNVFEFDHDLSCPLSLTQAQHI